MEGYFTFQWGASFSDGEDFIFKWGEVPHGGGVIGFDGRGMFEKIRWIGGVPPCLPLRETLEISVLP